MLTHYAKGRKSWVRDREWFNNIARDKTWLLAWQYLNSTSCPREYKSQKPKNQRCNTGKKRNAFLMDFFDELRGGVRASVLALCGIIVVCFHRMLWHQANKQAGGERGGSTAQHIFILKPAVWACCSCSCRFLHATIKKALGGDSGPGDDAQWWLRFCETAEAWLKREKCCQNAINEYNEKKRRWKKTC